MGMWIGRNRKARVTYGFDEIALVPGEVTINPNEVDTSFKIPRKDGSHITLKIPIIASAMDGVADVKFCVEMGKLGGLGVINLEGVQTRYENPSEVLEQVVKADKDEVTTLIQKLYLEPIKEELIARRVEELKKAGVLAAVSSIPQKAERFSAIAQEAGADLFVVQSTVSTVRHLSTEYKSLDLAAFTKGLSIPVFIGNAVTYNVTLELMGCGVAGVLIGVGPGAACTSRGVLGLGVPQVTATVDCAAARDMYHKKTGKYIPIITDGGMSKGGDVCKALACGSDAVMRGERLCTRQGSPGEGQPLGHGHSPREPPARHPHQGRCQRFAQADFVRPRFGGRWLAKPGRRHHHLHGQCRRSHHPPIPGNRNHHRPQHQDRRQIVSNGAKRWDGNKVETV